MNNQDSLRMKVAAACIAAAAAIDSASAFVVPVASSGFTSSSLGRSSVVRARAPGLRMSAVSTESKVGEAENTREWTITPKALLGA